MAYLRTPDEGTAAAGPFEAGEAALQRLIEQEGQAGSRDRNEATTRLQLINQLLFEVLGWNTRDCSAEDRLEGKYADYALSAPYVLLVVEAKREGDYFTLPAGVGGRQKIEFFRRHNVPTFRAIKQCAEYCQDRGARFGAVTNGHQIIAFLASRLDGVPPLQGECLAFDSLETLSKEFLSVWNALSKHGAQDHGLSRLLSEGLHVPPPKLSTTITGYPRYRIRNTLQTDLQILGDLIIEDVARLKENEPGFLTACYSASGALNQYSLLSRTVLQARYSSLMQQATEGPSLIPATTKRGIESEVLARGLSRRPILLVGDIGVGKTMFIRHLIRIDAKEIVEKAVTLYVDLGEKPTFTGDIKSFLSWEFEQQLMQTYGFDIREREFLEAAYREELQRFDKGVFGDLRETDPSAYAERRREQLAAAVSREDEHLRRAIDYIVEIRRRQVIVILDNVDQRPDDFQQEVFLIGTSIAETWAATVFIAIRPETYYRSRTGGTLAAYHPRAFTVAPPRLDRVISKRLTYALKMIESGQLQGLGDIAVDSESFHAYVTVLLQSFSRNKELIEFGENMCGGNIRLALEFIRIFLGSGHVDTAKILEIYAKSRRYQVALHEFLRAVMFGDYDDYNPDSSHIMNILDIASDDGRQHFLAPILLGHLDRLGRSQRDGFVSVADVYRFAQELGFSVEQVDWSFNRCLARRLLERPARTTEEQLEVRGVETAYVRVTDVGLYYVRRLLGEFTYLDAIVVDTPIVTPSTRQSVQDVRTIRERLERARLFVDYLDLQWARLPKRDLAVDWPSLSGQLRSETDIIAAKVH